MDIGAIHPLMNASLVSLAQSVLTTVVQLAQLEDPITVILAVQDISYILTQWVVVLTSVLMVSGVTLLQILVSHAIVVQ